MARLARLAVLVSGSGTNLEAMLTQRLPVSLVLADRDCRALAVARTSGLPTALIDRRDFGYLPRASWDRTGFTQAVAAKLREHQIDIVAMAGFMTVLTPAIFAEFPGRILNTHPSLLPRFKGGRAVADTLAAGAAESGVTVHLASPELDSGTVVAQAKVPVLPHDTVSSLWERIKTAERRLYPAVLRGFMEL
jgi:phosphoribosylglycinamide formyltransferase-1